MAATDYTDVSQEVEALGVGQQEDVMPLLGGAGNPWDTYIGVPLGGRYFKADGTWYYKTGAGDLAGDWTLVVGGGDISGPGSSTDNALVRWDGTAGDTIQNSTWTLTDAGLLDGDGGLKAQDFIEIKHATASQTLRIESTTGQSPFGASISRPSGTSGFMHLMPNSQSVQWIAADPAAANGVNEFYIDVDNQGTLYLNVLGGGGAQGDIVATDNAALRPNGSPSSSELGTATYRWASIYGVDLDLTGDITMWDPSETHTVTFTVPELAASYILTLPLDDGDTDDVLTTDGSGNLAFSNVGDLVGNGCVSKIINPGDWVLSAGTTYYNDFAHNLDTQELTFQARNHITNEVVGIEDWTVLNNNTVRVYIDGNADTIRAIACTGRGPAGPQGPTGPAGGGLENVVEDLTPQLGGDLDLNNFGIAYRVPTVNGQYSGEIVTAQVDTNATGIGAVLYMATDGNFDEANAASGTMVPARALAIESGTGSKKLLLKGYLRVDAWNWTPGGDIFVDTTAGALTQTAPTGSSQYVQKVGYAWDADTVFFAPGDYTLIERED